MIVSRLWSAVACAVFVLSGASMASAQITGGGGGNGMERPLEGTAGYMYTKFEGSSAPLGFYGEIARDILPEDRNLAWLGRFDFAHDGGNGSSTNLWHIKAGIRLKFPQGMFIPYVQGTGGLARETFSYDAGNGNDYSVSQTGLGFGGGGGAFIPVGRNGRVQTAIEYNRVTYSSGYGSWQFFVGYSICPGCESSMSPASGSSN
jgi:hypothetical protein